MAVTTQEIRERIDAAFEGVYADLPKLKNEVYALLECLEAAVPALEVYADRDHWPTLPASDDPDDEADPLWFDCVGPDGAPVYVGWRIAAQALASVGLRDRDEDE